MKKSDASRKKGFTIVELVIVIAVIAILAAVLIPTFSSVINSAHNSQASSQALNAFKEYMSAVLAKTGASSIRDGFVFRVGEYAFANIGQTVHQLEYVGENTVSGDEVLMKCFVLGDVAFEGSKKGDAAFELQPGTYKIYKAASPIGSETFYFWVLETEEGAENFQKIKGINDADAYIAAVVLTAESESEVITKYGIKTATNGLSGNNEDNTNFCWIYRDSTYTVDFSDVTSFTISSSGMTKIEINGHKLYDGFAVNSYKVSASDIRENYGSGNNAVIITP